MSDTSDEKQKAREIRSRAEYEDNLLNSRTNIVLTLNGLAAIAVGASLSASFKFWVAAIVIILNTLWLCCSYDAFHFIKHMHVALAKIAAEDLLAGDRLQRSRKQDRKLRLPSTLFMSLILPAMLLAGWIFFIASR